MDQPYSTQTNVSTLDLSQQQKHNLTVTTDHAVSEVMLVLMMFGICVSGVI